MTASRLALGVIASLGLFAVACGGDGDGDAAEDATAYFEGVEAAKARFDEGLPSDLSGQGVEFVARQLRQENGALTGFADDLSALEPPADIREEHADVVRLSRQRVQTQDRIASDVLERGAFDRSEIRLRENIEIEWANAVCGLERQATDAGITIDLGCDAYDFAALRAETRRTIRLAFGEASCGAAQRVPDAEVLARGQSMVIFFVNDGDDPVRIHGTGAGGDSEFVASLEPGDTHLEIATVGTGWFVTDAADECLGGIVAEGPEGINLLIDPLREQ